MLIFDLGGGTFDVSVLSMEEGIFEVSTSTSCKLEYTIWISTASLRLVSTASLSPISSTQRCVISIIENTRQWLALCMIELACPRCCRFARPEATLDLVVRISMWLLPDSLRCSFYGRTPRLPLTDVHVADWLPPQSEQSGISRRTLQLRFEVLLVLPSRPYGTSSNQGSQAPCIVACAPSHLLVILQDVRALPPFLRSTSPSLGTSSQVEIEAFAQGQDLKLTLSRAKFEDLNASAFASCIETVKKVRLEGSNECKWLCTSISF